MSENNNNHASTTSKTFSSVGVVFGDIGTSPLYTIAAIFTISSIAIEPSSIIGAVSCVFWMLIFVVSFKYILLILRADNHGEGGIFAMMALAQSVKKNKLKSKTIGVLLILGVIGASLFYGDSVITPAITVLSSMEGLTVFSSSYQVLIIPATLTIIALLFYFQRFGTDIVGKSFGPIMVIWFLMIGLNGLNNIIDNPIIINALNPFYALSFIYNHGEAFLFILGAVVLSITGAEALYADMGHFGRSPIRIAWFSLVFPCLTLCYFGQGSFLLGNPEALSNLFFLSFPSEILPFVFIIATLAAIIASQAVITGAFSLTQQAIQMGLLPRMRIVHTSIKERGQVYIPAVNIILGMLVALTVLLFGSTHGLAHAYGLSVTSAMLIDTVLAFFVARYLWNHSLLTTGTVTVLFTLIDISFVIACSLKFFEGGWYSLLLASGMAITILTWRKGRRLIHQKIRKDLPDLQHAIADIESKKYRYQETPGTAVFMIPDNTIAPQPLLFNLKHNHVLHSKNLVLSVITTDRPVETGGEKIQFKQLSKHFYAIEVHIGFMERANIPKILKKVSMHHIKIDPEEVSYFLGRITVTSIKSQKMNIFRALLFRALYFNASSAVSYFSIPSKQVIELGTKISL